MRIHRKLVLLFIVFCAPYEVVAQDLSSDAVVNYTVAISKTVHFQGPDGTNVIVPAGAYWITPQDGALQLFDVENGNTYIVRAVSGVHPGSLTQDVALSTPGTDEQPDVHSIVFLSADGSELVAEGTYSGIATRGLLGNAKAKADAARRAAQKRAQLAKNRALQAAAEAQRKAREAAANMRALAENFLNLSCEDKLNAMQHVTAQIANRVTSSAESSEEQARARLPIVDEVMQTLIQEAFATERPLVDAAIHMAAAARDPKTQAEIDRLVTNATCGIEPEATVERMRRLTSSLYQTATAASNSGVTTRGAGRDFMDDNLTITFDVSGGLTFPTRPSGRKAKTAAAGLGIAAGKQGNPPCTNPGQDRVCVRAYYYRHFGGSTPEAGFAIPVSVGVWRVNPRDLHGRYTNIGGSISFEGIAALYATGSVFATAATSGAAAPSTLGTIAGLTGVGFDIAFDRNIFSLIDCARENPSNWKTACRERPRVVGFIVNAGLSVSVNPLEFHRVSGSTWTWWWVNGHMTDVHGATRLWKDAIDYIASQR